MTRHEEPAARSVATCAASTVARGRPTVSPSIGRVAVLHLPLCLGARNLTLPPAAQHSSLGRRAQLRSASAVTAHLSDRPNWLTFHSKQDCEPPPQAHPCRPAYPSFIQQLRPGGADAEHCRRSCGTGVRTKMELPDRQLADAASLRSPHAAGLKNADLKPENWHRSRHARSMPKQRERNSEHCPQVFDVPLQHTRGKNLKSADLYRSWGFNSPSGHHTL
jgi:hypothetical protein